jgi:uncharacterized protein (DUF885 family)
MLVALSIASAPVQSSQTTFDKNAIAAASFPKLVEEYLADLHSRRPSLAASSGVHAHDGKLEDFSGSAIGDEVAAIKRFQSRLEKIPPLELSYSDLIDYQIIASNMKSRLLELEQVRSFERNPQVYNDVFSSGLMQIAMFDYAQPEERLRSVISKEKQAARLLDSARNNVRAIPEIFRKISIESFKGTLSFVQTDLPKAFAGVGDAKLQKEFARSTKSAADAIQKYIRHLERMEKDPKATFAIGKAYYEAKLRYDEGIDMPVETLLKIALRELDRTQKEFKETAAKIDPGKNPMQVWAVIQAEYPKPGTLVAEAQKQLDSLLDFIDEKKIVTLPGDERPIVAPTPDFFRWSTASMWTPGPFESRPLQARYLITDVDPEWSERQKQEYLSSFNYQQLWTTSIHEAYPGHFIQGAALRQVRSPVRKTWAIAPGSFVEGWAHYVEQMMIEEGFGGGDLKLRLGQLADALLRLCRFVASIRLHIDAMTVDQATRFFMDNAFMQETPARIEAERGTFDPMYLVYSLGKLAIIKMREDYRRYKGDDFSLKEFHDLLLQNGNAPLWAQRQLLMPGEKGKLIE